MEILQQKNIEIENYNRKELQLDLSNKSMIKKN